MKEFNILSGLLTVRGVIDHLISQLLPRNRFEQSPYYPYFVVYKNHLIHSDSILPDFGFFHPLKPAASSINVQHKKIWRSLASVVSSA